ncbi:hypothetical protein Droror1_Dr00012306 [Drosera rotundifolia]
MMKFHSLRKSASSLLHSSHRPALTTALCPHLKPLSSRHLTHHACEPRLVQPPLAQFTIFIGARRINNLEKELELRDESGDIPVQGRRSELRRGGELAEA